MLKDNQFTTWSLLEYMRRAFGSKVNGSAFNSDDICAWCRQMKVPVAYGGHKILDLVFDAEFDSLRIMTIEGLSREDIEATLGNLDKFERDLRNNRKAQVLKKPTRIRTPFYFKMLGKKLEAPGTQPLLPDNWKELGIIKTQIRTKRRK